MHDLSTGQGKRLGKGRIPWQWRFFLLTMPVVLAGCASTVPVAGLRPEYPEMRGGVSGRAFVRVDSLQPTLRWESFPRPQDQEADKDGVLNRIRNITYDLTIWRVEPRRFHGRGLDYPIELVYARQGLPEPLHTVADGLRPSTKYFWTVRARFELDGQTRVTRWGRVGRETGGRSPFVLNLFQYRFETSPQFLPPSASPTLPQKSLTPESPTTTSARTVTQPERVHSQEKLPTQVTADVIDKLVAGSPWSGTWDNVRFSRGTLELVFTLEGGKLRGMIQKSTGGPQSFDGEVDRLKLENETVTFEAPGRASYELRLSKDGSLKGKGLAQGRWDFEVLLTPTK